VIIVAALVALAVLLGGSAFGQPSYVVPDYTTQGTTWPLPNPAHFTLVEHQVRMGPPFQRIVGQNPLPYTHHHAGTIVLDVSISYPLVAVPDLTGKTQDQATQALAAAGLDAKFVQVFSDNVTSGLVASWTDAGAQVPQHNTVTVSLSGGRRFVPMPDVTGKTVAAAASALKAAGITNTATQTQAFSDTVPAGSVISTDPPAGASADRTQAPTLTVSKGPDLVTVPAVAHQGISAAEQAMTAAGLVVAGPYGPPGAPVIDYTSPPAGQRVKRGSTVVLYSGYV
jgi:serine/threonine-protein kinase